MECATHLICDLIRGRFPFQGNPGGDVMAERSRDCDCFNVAPEREILRATSSLQRGSNQRLVLIPRVIQPSCLSIMGVGYSAILLAHYPIESRYKQSLCNFTSEVIYYTRAQRQHLACL